jgi:hypothetical protein
VLWDCVMFAGEVDVLKCRLATAAPYDVHHIIAESATDNNGSGKDLSFYDIIPQITTYMPRITYINVPGMPGPSAWNREHQLRDVVLNTLSEHAQAGDWVLIADVDEIPAPELLAAPRVGMLMMRNIMLSLNRALPATQPTSVLTQWPLSGALSVVRDNRYSLPCIDSAGWHLSWLGGTEARTRKQAMHCHAPEETQVQFDQLVPNDDMPEWCREHAPDAWWHE